MLTTSEPSLQCHRVYFLVATVFHVSDGAPLYQGILTAERNDGHSVQLVLRPDVGPQTNDENVSKAGNCRHNPDKDSLNDVCQEVLQRRNSIRVGLTAAHVRCIATVLKPLKIADV